MPRKSTYRGAGDAAGIHMAQHLPNPPSAVNLDHLPADMRQAVLNYSPLKVPRQEWLAVRERVLLMLSYLELDHPEAPYRAIRFLSAYLHALHRDGMDVATLPVEVLFDAHRIESYVSGQRIPFAAETEMRALHRLAKQLNPSGAWPIARKPHPGAGRLGAYSPEQIVDVFAAIDGMRNGKSKDRQTVVANIILGCGATPAEVFALHWDMFEEHPGGVLIAHLPGGANRRHPLPPRQVPVADPYRRTVTALARQRYGKVVPQPDANELAKAVASDSRSMRSAPRIQMSRFRATWMVERARAGANWVDIARLAGVLLQSLAQVLDGDVDGDPEPDLHTNMTRSGR